jgi:Zn-dependent protease/predicted transcriptional regulator
MANNYSTAHSIRIFKVFGIEIWLDLSVIIIFSLIVFSLGNGLLPRWHADWDPALIWGTAIASGILFFLSLLAHELAHSVVAQKFGIAVPRITLFLFGGMAETSREPDTAKVEFLVAIAGPAMSIAISLVCTNLALWMSGDANLVEQLSAGESAAIAALGPLQTSLLWLGSINMILAIFNLIPGFPMDGGRVFRAIAWQITGDQVKATLWASYGGRLFGWTLMILGVMQLFSGAGLGGLWWILIGWFISNLAAMSYRQLITDRALTGFRVADLMNTHFESATVDTPVQTFIDDHLLRSTQALWPVFDGDCLRGYVALSDVVHVSNEERQRLLVRDVMRPPAAVPQLAANEQAKQALTFLANAREEPVPVVSGEELVGLIQRGDIVRWLSLHDI